MNGKEVSKVVKIVLGACLFALAIIALVTGSITEASANTSTSVWTVERHFYEHGCDYITWKETESNRTFTACYSYEQAYTPQMQLGKTSLGM